MPLMGSNTPGPLAMELDTAVVDSFDFGANSADQPTATDAPVIQPSSGTADPTATGTY